MNSLKKPLHLKFTESHDHVEHCQNEKKIATRKKKKTKFKEIQLMLPLWSDLPGWAGWAGAYIDIASSRSAGRPERLPAKRPGWVSLRNGTISGNRTMWTGSGSGEETTLDIPGASLFQRRKRYKCVFHGKTDTIPWENGQRSKAKWTRFHGKKDSVPHDDGQHSTAWWPHHNELTTLRILILCLTRDNL